MRRVLRKLLVLTLAAWLPVFAGSAVASVVCEGRSSGHPPGEHVHLSGSAAFDERQGAALAGCQDCDACYAHCALGLPADANYALLQSTGSGASAEPALLGSLSHPPADRPPLIRLG